MDPLEDQNGNVVFIRVDNIDEERLLNFDNVQKEVRSDIINQRQKKELEDISFQYLDDINKILKLSMSKKVKVNHMDKLLVSIFRSAIYEILFSEDLTKKIVISEYLLIANRFFGNNETALLNGVLDNLQNS